MGAVSLEFAAASNDRAALAACQPKRGATSIQRKNIAQIDVSNLSVSPELQHVDLAAFLRFRVDEMYFVPGATIPDEPAERRQQAQRRRMDQSQRITCGACSRRTGDADRDVAARSAVYWGAEIPRDAIASPELQNVG